MFTNAAVKPSSSARGHAARAGADDTWTKKLILTLFISSGLTFAITGSKKQSDEGAPLFAARVDGVVGDEYLFRLVNHLDGLFLNLLGNLN